MYQTHPCFVSPSSEDAKVWRYIDFVKYVNMLDKSSLYFVRADKLDDPFEGSFTKANIKLRPQAYANTPITPEVITKITSFVRQSKAFTAINSWHLNDSESAAMWNLYAKNNQGIAIQSTFKRLKESLIDGNYTIFVGEVTYVDWDNYYIPESNLFFPFVHKRKSFEYEQELRAVVQKIPTKDGASDLSVPLWENGVDIQVDLRILVEKIYLSPLTPNWIFDLVKSVTTKYNQGWEVNRSSLDESPVY